jgi:hypothetical protein
MKGSDDARIAWLAGFWDGEGSIGLTKSGTTYILNAQMSHTDLETVRHVLGLLEAFNVRGRGYTYQERDPAKHRDAHYIRIGGISNVKDLAELLRPHSITKRAHWELAIEWANNRIRLAGGVDANGRLLRTLCSQQRGYSETEVAIAQRFSDLNKRGPESRAFTPQGRLK